LVGFSSMQRLVTKYYRHLPSFEAHVDLAADLSRKCLGEAY
jgi:hypothetical protein